MNEIYKMILERLENKRNELKERQEYFSVMCEREMQSGTFVRNAISDLVVMQQLKSEIGELEYWEIFLRVRLLDAEI